MYIFYIDECGRPSLEDKALHADPWFTIVAAAIHSNDWLAIDNELTRIKQIYFPDIKPIKIEIKSTNLRSYGGPYPRWPFSLLKPERMRALVEEVYAIYDRFKITLFAVVVNRKEHKERYESLGHRPDPPYQLAFRFLVERMDWFLEEINQSKPPDEREIGFVILDEYVGQYKITRSNLLWYQESGTFAKPNINFIKEVPFFNVSQYSQLLTLPDLEAYNVYARFRYNKPEYPFYVRLLPRLYRRFGKPWGYGLKVFPDREALPAER
ncbi:MAG: DUF3800 domain-containing protein [Chloroflexi bacterium]|nr:DUF3800 domain-containing protein [Chloroflexota bacterium]